MKQFNINRIIERHGLDTEETAKILFPHVKYPKQAFDRVLKGEADLDASQIEMLATHAGVLVNDLFTLEEWKGSQEDGCMTLQKGEYKAKLNYKGVFVTIYKKDKVIKQIVTNTHEMKISEFIEFLNNNINIYENGSNEDFC